MKSKEPLACVSAADAVRHRAMELPSIDLNLLVALHALLRERNVTRAGEGIGLSQPAMTPESPARR